MLCLEVKAEGLGQDPPEVVRYLLVVSRAQAASFRVKAAPPEHLTTEEQAFCVFFWGLEMGKRLLRRSTMVTIRVSERVIKGWE